MLVTLAGMVTDAKLLHIAKAKMPMTVTPAGMVMAVKLVHTSKA